MSINQKLKLKKVLLINSLAAYTLNNRMLQIATVKCEEFVQGQRSILRDKPFCFLPFRFFFYFQLTQAPETRETHGCFECELNFKKKSGFTSHMSSHHFEMPHFRHSLLSRMLREETFFISNEGVM